MHNVENVVHWQAVLVLNLSLLQIEVATLIIINALQFVMMIPMMFVRNLLKLWSMMY